ncbi:MAG: V/A-type H+/Na+-transporting ATPase subunit [Thermoanaerobacteraceae bacterium]|jgi:V/A-type H+-transporting ATPase subunit F|uniref:V-type ATP synthase subunit F n=1 Tax=Biomaibacter acetigenes TaxID=2316383 RepID=A0A3G2R8S9_9FIRM|nr:V-type ATP synthase subunit F [Biomaibacter acetigenes]MDK2879709.1 V/A-type H+/Na+-transporting ATPase subunit [Thermoanaerobacteraceae bacterium]RKL62480.1 V-type ATP synthase subunit F [Thermoanaerobacteraceae bacterium SP2]AYO31799.1 V-type ATP synthase subunit F [Biomaibacter acetigenes]MDN5302447.1 V/A-type H+/Na+-transporting ATPase subunit [Thermoanaerobacteraceae bacterium]MDN5312898.1 V/A-type H+/Na+-transporting ATPase subunit [Thermoanaerobacteraceae bacterium]
MSTYKIGVIGDKDTVLAFKSLGVDIFPAMDEKEAGHILTQLAKQNYAVIFITEQLAKDMKERIDMYRNKMLPAITLIPSNRGSLGIGIQEVKKSVEKAIGVDILFEREGEE